MRIKDVILKEAQDQLPVFMKIVFRAKEKLLDVGLCFGYIPQLCKK